MVAQHTIEKVLSDKEIPSSKDVCASPSIPLCNDFV